MEKITGGSVCISSVKMSEEFNAFSREREGTVGSAATGGILTPPPPVVFVSRGVNNRVKVFPSEEFKGIN